MLSRLIFVVESILDSLKTIGILKTAQSVDVSLWRLPPYATGGQDLTSPPPDP
jgi:hypothetical protein